MEITLGHTYRWHATTETYRWHATSSNIHLYHAHYLVLFNNNELVHSLT